MAEYPLTLRQEAFARDYIETGNATEAYRRNYKCDASTAASVNRMAKQTMDNLKVLSRINELKDEISRRHDITVDSLTQDAMRICAGAEQVEQFGAANSALTLIAKLHGKLVDQSRIQLNVSDITEADKLLKEAGIL